MILKSTSTHTIVTITAWANRPIIAITQLLIIKILLEGLGSQQYALFALLTSLMSWYMLADMGIGMSLQNHISECRAHDRSYAPYLAVSAMVTVIVLVLTVGTLYILSPYIAKVFLKQFNFLSENDKARLFFVSGSLFLISSIGSIAYKVWYAQQKGYLSNIIPTVASVIGLIMIEIIMHINLQNKIYYSIVAFILPSSVLSVVSFVVQIRAICRSNFKISKAVFSKIIKRATPFWLITIFATIILNLDYIIMSQLVSPLEIVIYSMATKIFGFMAFFYTSLYSALWPKFSELTAVNDWQGVRLHLRNAIFSTVGIITVSTIIILLFMPYIAKILSPKEVLAIPKSFILLLGSYYLISGTLQGFATVLQSMSDTRIILAISPIQALLSISFQIFLTPILGIHGITLGIILSLLFTAAWVLPKRVGFHLKNGLIKNL